MLVSICGQVILLIVKVKKVITSFIRSTSWCGVCSVYWIFHHIYFTICQVRPNIISPILTVYPNSGITKLGLQLIVDSIFSAGCRVGKFAEDSPNRVNNRVTFYVNTKSVLTK